MPGEARSLASWKPAGSLRPRACPEPLEPAGARGAGDLGVQAPPAATRADRHGREPDAWPHGLSQGAAEGCGAPQAPRWAGAWAVRVTLVLGQAGLESAVDSDTLLSFSHRNAPFLHAEVPGLGGKKRGCVNLSILLSVSFLISHLHPGGVIPHLESLALVKVFSSIERS